MNSRQEEQDIDFNVLNDMLRVISPAFFEEHGAKVLRVILDTSKVLEDIRHYVRTKNTPALADLLRSGMIKAYAPLQIELELHEHIPEIAKKLNCTEDLLIKAWEDLYKPYIEIVDTSQLPTSSLLLEALRDSNDMGFVQVYEKERADYILSKDNKHLGSLGVAPLNTHQLIVDMRPYVVSKTIVLILVDATTVCCLAVLPLTQALLDVINLLFNKFKSLPSEIKIIILFSVCVPFAFPGARKWLREKTQQLLTLIQDPKIRDAILGFVEFINQHYSSVQSFESQLPQKKVGLRPFKSLKEHIFHALTVSPCPLSSEDITEKVLEYGYRTKNRYFNAYVLRILRQSPEFIEGSYGWRIAD